VLEDTKGHNQFYVFIDDKLQPVKLATKAGRHAYGLASGLAPGPHQVILDRLTEALLGETKFLGFQFGKDGKLLADRPAPTRRRIEVIGDSLSAGYGNEGTDKSCPFTPETENHYLTYESLAARRFDAELVTIAWSGKGVFSNRGDKVDRVVMPTLWKRTLPDRDDSRWNFAKYQPDLVVINLGTNDFAPENQDWSPFASAYLGLVNDVRAHYPKATILCVLGPALTDAWPQGRSALTTARQGITRAVDQLRGAGDKGVDFLEFPVQTEANGYGCDWHPNLKTHALMADDLTRYLREKLGWATPVTRPAGLAQ